MKWWSEIEITWGIYTKNGILLYSNSLHYIFHIICRFVGIFCFQPLTHTNKEKSNSSGSKRKNGCSRNMSTLHLQRMHCLWFCICMPAPSTWHACDSRSNIGTRMQTKHTSKSDWQMNSSIFQIMGYAEWHRESERKKNAINKGW